MSPAKENEREGEMPPPRPISKDELDLATLYQLPAGVRPTAYKINAAFSIARRAFVGRLSISLAVSCPTRHIYLNAKSLELSSLHVLTIDSSDKCAASIGQINQDLGVIRIDLTSELPIGNSVLVADFIGKVRTGLQGVYLNRYMDAEGEEQEGVATMFAATEARTFIPCWDQPDIKATFELSILVPAHLTVLSNMAATSSALVTAADLPDYPSQLIEEQLGEADWQRFSFSPTPKMSTYLLCFVIGQYSATSAKVGSTEVSVFSPLNRESEAVYALQVATKCLNIFNDFFGIPYCLPKLDLIAVSCISVGAMENWGLITFRENCLLVRPGTASSAQLQAVATIVAHEISHQWFGNLVTMTWWSDLWLNEGFATFMQYYAIDKIHPEFEIWEQFCSDVLIVSLQLDALENSHPVKVKVNNPEEIDEVFDKISYKKGASLIRMLHKLMGEQQFIQGIRRYCEQHSYGNACTEDLWACLGSVKGTTVADIMNCWVSNVGFPLIKVTVREGSENRMLVVSQERFSAAHKSNSGVLWKVPVRILVQPSRDAASGQLPPSLLLPEILLQERRQEIPLPPDLNLDLARGAFLKLNPGFHSYFRAEYSAELGEALEQGVSSLSLEPADRLSTIEDKVSMLLSDQGSTVSLMKMVAELKSEDSFLVWKNLASFFHVLRCIVWSSPALAAQFDRYVISVMEPCMERVGWSMAPGENHMTTMLRSLLICQLGTRGCESVVQRCLQLLPVITGEKSSRTELEPGLKEVVMKVALAGTEDHSALDSLLPLLDIPQERNSLLQSLGYAHNKDVLSRALNLALSPKLRDQEAVMVVESVCQNRLGVHLAWNFFKDHLADFYGRYGHGLFLMAKLIKCVTENFSTEEALTEVTEYFAAHSYIGCQRTIQQARENIYLNMHWKNKDLDSVSKFLATFTKE